MTFYRLDATNSSNRFGNGVAADTGRQPLCKCKPRQKKTHPGRPRREQKAILGRPDLPGNAADDRRHIKENERLYNTQPHGHIGL